MVSTLLLVLSLFTHDAWSADDEAYYDVEPDSTFLWKTARVAQASLLQKSGNTFSGLVGWDPAYLFNDQWGVRANVSLGLLRNADSSVFLNFEYLLMASYQPIPAIGIEAGVGAQTWANNGGTSPVIASNVVFYLEQAWFGVLDRFTAGYSNIFVANNNTHQIKAGVGLSF